METQSFEKFSITLPAEMARVIREKVSSGDYGSAGEAAAATLP
jgi:Arc/MetJ-type ribon-helix-helix transcriptional regulator